MNIIDKLDLHKRISKSEINLNGNLAIVLFDNSSEFAVQKIVDDKLELLYYHDLGNIILDFCFSGKGESVWFCMLGAINIEWHILERQIRNTCGIAIENSLDNKLSGYPCIKVLPKQNMVVAVNLGNFRLEFYNLQTLEHIKEYDSLCEIYAKKICIHPNENIIAVLITDTEDSSNIRFFEIGDRGVKLYKKYIAVCFAGSSCSFSNTGNEFLITGGYPLFCYAIHKFPSLDFINEFVDDEGLSMPEPWGNTNGISFNNDFILSNQEELFYTPYFNGDIATVNMYQGEVTELTKCNDSLCLSISQSIAIPYLFVSSISGQNALLNIKDDQSFYKNGSNNISISLQDTTDNLLLPLSKMEEFISNKEEASTISK